MLRGHFGVPTRIHRKAWLQFKSKYDQVSRECERKASEIPQLYKDGVLGVWDLIDSYRKEIVPS